MERVILVLVGAVLYALYQIGAAPEAAPVQASVPAADVVSSSDYRYDAPPSISRDAYVAIVCQAGPACDDAGAMYDVLVEAGIDPVIEAAQAMHETGIGTQGIGQSQYKNLHGVQCHASDGRIADSSVPWGNGCAGVYASYTDSVRTWANVINREYVAMGLDTPALAVSKYAPVSDGNDPPAYVADMERHVDQWRAEYAASAAPAPAASGGQKCGFTDTMAVGEGSSFYSTGSGYWSGQYGGMHLGDDMVGNPGDAVYAPWDMTIDSVGEYTDPGRFGKNIQAHIVTDGYLFYAGHLIDVYVSAGQLVPACTQIGTLGATAGPHTHIKMASPGAPIPCEGSEPGPYGCIDPIEYWETH